MDESFIRGWASTYRKAEEASVIWVFDFDDKVRKRERNRALCGSHLTVRAWQEQNWIKTYQRGKKT